MKIFYTPPPRAVLRTIIVALRGCMIKRATLSLKRARAIVAFLSGGGNYRSQVNTVITIGCRMLESS